ncbi:tetraspanin family protein [Mycobacteroides salmoniphilum]|uniref:tetraspanin family protein n=1 Tax=Mycobacteroides salmoniphilum TaxID=404941 RepID=UPI001065C47C|nr:hypothetical protein DE4586_03519 [Mycobacteroides salmoniphilum]TDZ84145.1 hypothetical protein DE4587_03061 [Mycobacteroides salmoniphilum]
MSENIDKPVTGPENRAESSSEATTEEKGRPSILLALSGLVALVVGGWALTGQDFGALVHSNLLGWVAIAVAIAIGVALVAVPTRRNRT